MKLGTCRSCHAPVLWVRTENGRNMPLDTKAERRVVVVTRALGPDMPNEEVARVVETYQSHFSSCPNADEHRKGIPGGIDADGQPIAKPEGSEP